MDSNLRSWYHTLNIRNDKEFRTKFNYMYLTYIEQ